MNATAEGLKRPSHFRGVSTVVTKLFNIFQPDKAYFGQKDAIQSILIKYVIFPIQMVNLVLIYLPSRLRRKMVKDLNFPIDVVISPTVRDPDGLAMSSRNSYLSQKDRVNAPVLYHSLKAGEAAYRSLLHPRRSEIVEASVTLAVIFLPSV